MAFDEDPRDYDGEAFPCEWEGFHRERCTEPAEKGTAFCADHQPEPEPPDDEWPDPDEADLLVKADEQLEEQRAGEWEPRL